MKYEIIIAVTADTIPMIHGLRRHLTLACGGTSSHEVKGTYYDPESQLVINEVSTCITVYSKDNPDLMRASIDLMAKKYPNTENCFLMTWTEIDYEYVWNPARVKTC